MTRGKKVLFFGIVILFWILEISEVHSSIKRQLDEEDDEEVRPRGQNCNETESKENAARCTIENMDCADEYKHDCVCKKGYTHAKGKEAPEKYCNLKQKKQLTAFLLELFVGFGAAHFYRKAYLMASLKLAAFVFGIYVICLFPLTAKCVTDCCESDCLVIIVSIIFYLYSLGLAFWYIWDLVYFGKNKYLDYSYDPHIELSKW